MSKVAIQGNASGTATFTVAAPVGTGVDRTLTLPDEAGTVLTSASSIPASSVTGLLTGKHFFHVYRNADQTFANNSNVIAIFDTEFVDVSSAYNTSTGEFTVPEDGLYFFVASAFHSGSGNTNLWNGRTAVRQAGSLKLHHEYNYRASYPNEVVQQASGIIDCTAGDVIDVQVRIETLSGSGPKLTGGTPTYFLGVMIA
jgi:hypothetical protein